MAEKDFNLAPKKLSLFRLVKDQARLDNDVLGHKYEGAGTKEDPYVVTWLAEDAGNPFNWTISQKWIITLIVAVACFATAFASSAFSGTIVELEIGLGASTELITAGISLFVLGFAVGPLIWAPLSEIFGRQVVFIVTFAAFTAFNAGCAGVNNIGGLLVLRFFAGSFGSSLFTNAGGVIADVFTASDRGFAMSIFALAPSMGPTLGPFIAGFLGETEGWRWVMGLMAIFSGVLWVLGAFFVPETYAPVLLRKRAAALSKKTGNVYMTKMDIERGPISPVSIITTALVRPWILLFLEPIVFLLSIYIAIIYGTLYLLFGAFPIVFELHRGWSEGISGLAFLGVAVGMISAIIFVLTVLDKMYLRHATKAGGHSPEARLHGAMIGAVAIPIGMFWFAWTNYSSVYWLSPVAAGIPFGFGLVLVFLSVTNYLIDAYTIFAASVLAANTVLRSLFGAAFPLFTEQMYTKLGIHWASSVPAFLALACVPFPFILYKYGVTIRRRCEYASKAEQAMNELRAKAMAAATGAAPPAAAVGGATDPVELTRTMTMETVKDKETDPYQASPYDIDRVNTTTSVKGLNQDSRKTGA